MEPARILIVDDQDMNRQLLSDLVAALGHHPLTAETGLQALETARDESGDLMLLDIMMPVMDGYEVLEKMTGDGDLRHIPVIMVSGIDEMQSMVRCIEGGADDYLIKPFNSTLLRARINACLEKKQLHDREVEYKQRIEENNVELEDRVRVQVERISTIQLATIFAMSKLAESRDPETGEHLERMREYARTMSQALSALPKYAELIDDSFVGNLYAAAPLHDIGKVGVPDRILQKPGKLTPEEFEVIKMHAMIGADTLRAVDEQYPGNEFLRMGTEVAESHHEKWDGAGYPRGLAGEEIPLVGRIMALADVYDALTSKRCYKEAFSHEKSASIIKEGRGGHFDPEIVDVFSEHESAFIEIRERFQDSEKVMLT
ncbi:MAG: response regulator [bacterium]|nr:response regulator [bacterium]